MASSYKTPGVYVEEIPNLPQSVADVPTAIPGFVGYTEGTTSKPGNFDSTYKFTDTRAVKIKSLLEYEQVFGKGPKPSKENKFVLYDSIRLFFENGGSVCYVVSVGGYDTKDFKNGEDLKKGLNALADIDEVTLLVVPDAATCLNVDALASVQQAALLQCKKLRDRFAILDVKDDAEKTTEENVQAFRDRLGNNGVEFGAAYYPNLVTTYSHSNLALNEIVTKLLEEADVKNLLNTTFKGDLTSQLALVYLWGKEKLSELLPDVTTEQLKRYYDKSAVTEEVKTWVMGKECPLLKDKEADAFAVIDNAFANNDANIKSCFFSLNPAPAIFETAAKSIVEFIPKFDDEAKKITDHMAIVPPSGAIAGIYSQVDSTKGVWQAPANISLASVKGLTQLINNQDQEDMNVSTSGLSVNAIRAFSGKGILVWGARTLKGNDSEWRYISVRRLFNYVEESIQESTDWAVFAPNTLNTWMKIKSQIENFLYNIWRAGGLAGATPDDAYFVNVGLGSTMTPQDVLDGYLRVEIGMAAVRPAEFVVLSFSHKLQES